MSEVTLNSKNLLASGKGLVLKTVTIGGMIRETEERNGRTIINAGSVVYDSHLGHCIAIHDIDITDGPRTCSVLYSGLYFGSALHGEVSDEVKRSMALHGLVDCESSETPVSNLLRVINNSSNTVEVYYDIDKQETGNTFIPGGSFADISIFETQDGGLYIRYSSGEGSSNTHRYVGTYRGNSADTIVNYYDGNVQPPFADGSITQWDFLDGDSGTLTISGSAGPTGNYITYDGINRIAYGENADNLIVY